jgi:hypothetical protein
MKKLIIAFPIILLATAINAQVSVGKKIQTTSVITLNTTVTQMGTEMEIPQTTSINVDFEIKSVTGNTIALSSTLKKVAGKVTVMGNDQSFDSDDAATASNPQMADALKDLNKPLDVTIDLGKTSVSKDITNAQSGEDIAGYLFLPAVASLKEGFSWSDSSSTPEGSKNVNNFSITKVSKDEVVITLISNNKTVTTKQQMGMEMKINMQGASTVIRVYDPATTILKSASSTFTSSGSSEVMGQTIPVSMKGSSTLTVK